MNKKLKNNKGFTLVELIVVIAIIGILVAIAVPRFNKSLDSAEAAADEATAKTLQTAVNMYYLDEGSYPADDDVSDLVASGGVLNEYISEVEAQSGATNTVFTYADGVITYHEQ